MQLYLKHEIKLYDQNIDSNKLTPIQARIFGGNTSVPIIPDWSYRKFV